MTQQAVTAFTLAIDLVITAPDDESLDRAVALAEKLAIHLTPEQFEQVKAQYEIYYDCEYIEGDANDL